MIIKTTNGGIIETDKLTDIESMVIEKFEELYQYCLSNNIQFAATYLSKETAHTVFNFQNKSDNILGGLQANYLCRAILEFLQSHAPQHKIITVTLDEYNKIQEERNNNL